MELIETIQDALPDGYANAILWIAFALLALVVVLGLIRLIRGVRGGTFVAGGRNRRTRLAVMDAAAIDSRRRLVLVRRDDVEHLVLIGGPTDLVIERDIRMVNRAARHGEQHHDAVANPAPTSPELERARAQVRAPQAAPRPAQPPRPVEPVLPTRPASAASNVTLPRPAIPMPAPPPPPAAAKPGMSAPAARPFETPKPATASASLAPRMPQVNALDDALLKELSLSLEQEAPSPGREKNAAPKRSDASLDEQMNKLLGEISKRK